MAADGYSNLGFVFRRLGGSRANLVLFVLATGAVSGGPVLGDRVYLRCSGDHVWGGDKKSELKFLSMLLNNSQLEGKDVEADLKCAPDPPFLLRILYFI